MRPGTIVEFSQDSTRYFSQLGALHSTLGVQNNTLSSKDVTFTIFNRRGEALHLGVITVQPGGRAFKLEELIKDVRKFESGNIKLEYDGQPAQIRCQLGVFWPEKRISFESKASTPRDFRSSQLNGIAWFPDRGSEASVAMTNASDHKVTVSFSTGERSREFILTPRATHVVRLREEFAYERESGAVLVRLKHDGEPGAVIATGFVLNPERGYSTTFGFVDPQSIVTNRLAGAHVWFGYPDNKEGFPQDTKFRAPLILANVSTQTVKARVSVDYTLSAAPASLGAAEERIRPGETKVIELTDEMAKLGIAGPVEDAGVDITYDGAPGSLIAHLTSVDQTGDFSLETPIKDPGEVTHMSGNAHPWNLENGTRTVLHLKNTTNKKVAVLVQIRFPGGSYNPDRVILQPFQTIAIDMQEMKDSRKKDIRGNVFPETAMGGLVEWIEQTPKAVIGRAEHVNVGQGIARSFSCPSCNCPNSYVDSWMVPSSVTKAVGDAGYFFSPQEHQQDCNGVQFGPYGPPLPYNWAGGGSVATVDGSGYVHAIAPGSSSIVTNFTEYNWWWSGPFENTCENTSFPLQTSGTINVKPKITGISPARGLIGTSLLTVTITGTGLAGATSIAAGTGINATVSNSTATQITANFAIASNATLGNHSVTVTVAGQPSNSLNFFVQKPATLSVISPINVIANGANGGCIDGTFYGIRIDVKYQVMDQDTPAVAIQSADMVPQESINGTAYVNIGPDAVMTSQFTDADGTYHDAPVGTCSISSFSQPFTQVVRIGTNGTNYSVRTNSFTVSGSTAGHGSITNGSDIVKSR